MGLSQGPDIERVDLLILAFAALIFGAVVYANAGGPDGAEVQPLIERQKLRTGYVGPVGVVAVKQGDGWIMSQGYPQPLGKCDDKSDCEAAVKKMCEDAGHGGVKPESVEVTQGKMCSGDCKQHGAVAFVMCADPQLLAR